MVRIRNWDELGVGTSLGELGRVWRSWELGAGSWDELKRVRPSLDDLR